MSLTMITAEIRPDAVDDVDASLAQLFAALHETAPDGVRYSSLRSQDGLTAVVFLELEDPAHNPLPGIPEFGAFQQVLQSALSGPPRTEPVEVKGSYRLF